MTSTTTTTNLDPQNQAQIQQKNFWHLYWDIAGFGILQGSTLAFIVVFATRLGATGWQIGLLTAGPALVNILLTLPAGRWLSQRDIAKVVVQTAFWSRLGYFFLIPIPFILSHAMQVWLILALALIVSIPGVALAISFNGLLAAAVPPEHRGHVVGRRNSLLAAMTMLCYFLSGALLDNLPLYEGYAIVFTIGALGSAFSTYHLSQIKLMAHRPFEYQPIHDRARPGRSIGFIETVNSRQSVSPRLWLNWKSTEPSLLSQITPRYQLAMAAFFCFHFTQMLLAPVTPIFFVRELHLTDGEISWLNVIFHLTVLICSTFLARLTHKFGNYSLLVGGATLLSVYPLFNGLSPSFFFLLLTNIAGGMIWSILSGALTNRLLELAPADNRAPYLAVYNLALNVAIFSSAMSASFMVELLPIRQVLILIFILRLGSGFILFKWG